MDAPALIGRLDAWWPTLFTIESGPRPVSTVQFTAELLADPASLDPALPLRYRAEMISLRDGFFLESRELWRGDELVALNQQTFVMIK
jgi:acyl-CoA hydrolase